MRPSLDRDFRALLSFFLLFTNAFQTNGILAQDDKEVRVAPTSLKIRPVAANENSVQVNLRMMESSIVTAAVSSFQTATGETTFPVSWTAFDSIPPGNCAWLILVDNSNPARQRTVEACASEVRTFLRQRPKSDSVMIATLSRDLTVLAPFDAKPLQLEAALERIKAEGDAAFTTLIFQNAKYALTDHLAGRPEARKCVVLLSDGKDETPGGPLRVTERRNEFITAATKLGIPVHTFGFAERADEGNYFADLKELSAQTDGLHAAAVVATRQLPPDTWDQLIGVMHSGGTATLDLPAGSWQGPLKLTMNCSDGRTAELVIPQESLPLASPKPSPHAMQAERNSKAPAWLGWTVGSLALLIWFTMKKRPSNRTDNKNHRLQEAAVANATADDSLPRIALAFLETMDGTTERLPVTADGVTIDPNATPEGMVRKLGESDSHYSLTLGEGGWVIADTGSVNGLRVNGTYYHQATLNHGDVIDMGEVRLRFVTA